MNRRTFLKSAAAGMGTLALPGARAHTAASGRHTISSQPTSTGADVVAVGAGAFGGWTALYLREMGVNVTMVDAYGAGNARASSGGETRQIRAGYANQEYYTRWVVEAFARWKKRQAEWGRTLFFETGQISLVPEWTKNLKETQVVLDRVGVETHVLTRAEVVRRFPQVNADGINLGVYTPGTGVLNTKPASIPISSCSDIRRSRMCGSSAADRVMVTNTASCSASTLPIACSASLRIRPWSRSSN